MHRSSATTTTTIRPAATTWDKPRAQTQASIVLKKEEPKKTEPKTITTTRTGSFYDQQTFWEQEMHRYHPSWWLLVRVGSLLAYPCIASFLGPYIYPHVVAFAEYQETEIQKVAMPLIAAMSMLAFFTHNALYGLIYRFEIKAFDTYRVDDKPWHWDMEPDQWKEMLRNTLGLVLFNFLLTFPPMLLNIHYGIGTPVRVEPDSLPGWLEIFWQLMFCTVMEDFGFHHAHALLHTKPLYWIHKIHHRYHAPIAISGAYAHPIEYLFGNILPSLLGPMILRKRMHLWAFGFWTIFRGSAAIENHSGYEFPWSMYQAIPFKAPTEYHDFHHNRNQETYSGVLRFWDYVYGTNKQYFEWVQAGRPDTFKTQKFKEKQRQQSKEE